MPPTSSVLRTPRGSITNIWHSCSADGLCRSLRGTTNTPIQFDSRARELGLQSTRQHNKRFVCFRMFMPDKLTLDFDDFELIVLEFGDHFR